MEPHALVVGESLVDIVTTTKGRSTEVPGGSAANVAVALARLGRSVRFATSFGADERGKVAAAQDQRSRAEARREAGVAVREYQEDGLGLLY